MINEVLTHKDYMSKYFYSMEEDAVPTTTTVNVSSAPVILTNVIKRHKKNFLEKLAEDYVSNKNYNI